MIQRKQLAKETLDAIERGFYTINDVHYDLVPKLELTNQHTLYHASDSALLSPWSTNPSPNSTSTQTISILEISALEGARYLFTDSPSTKIGLLNFASAKNPGGGFLRGTQAQEESIARSSTLYPSLLTPTAQPFYQLHKKDPKDGYYSHAMVYSPSVVLCRDDGGQWEVPVEVDVLTSPAVNAGLVRKNARKDGDGGDGEAVERKIEEVMRERMGRILCLFEKQGARCLVLGSFGTGVFRNNVSMVARVWADLLGVEGARYKDVFDRVVFAILGKKTFDEFSEAYRERIAAS